VWKQLQNAVQYVVGVEGAMYMLLTPHNEAHHNKIMRPQKIVEESKYNVT
jgi:hypothetical protein